MCSRDDYYVNSLRKISSASACRSCHPIPKDAKGTAHKDRFLFGGASICLAGGKGRTKSHFSSSGGETKRDSLSALSSCLFAVP